MAKSRVVVVGGLFALSLLTAAACDRGSGQTGPACDKTAAQIVTVLTKGKQDVHSMEAKSAIVKRCTDDKWSDEARTCIAKAQSRDELETCTHDKLTGEQADHLHDSSRGLGSSTAEAIAKMQEFAEKMCACKDAKCAQDISDEMTKWSQEQAKEEEEPRKLSEEEMKKASEIGQRMGDCMVKAMGADLAPVTGDDPTPLRDEPASPDADGREPTHQLKEGDKTPDGKLIVK